MNIYIVLYIYIAINLHIVLNSKSCKIEMIHGYMIIQCYTNSFETNVSTKWALDFVYKED